ncbi:MAG: hypothetical protein HN707_08010, partial [Verrucomicrobia bacterium]|nr:hypothetical protein [Verrucomicrobiota bacterium]
MNTNKPFPYKKQIVFRRFQLALTIAFLAQSVLIRAATITVQNANDSGAGSLRQAIADAATGDTIEFSQAMTSTLTSPITIDKDIVIDGANVVTISGDNATSIFKITSGNVEIKSITLRDGLAQGGNGENNGRLVRHAAGGGGAGMGGAIAVQGGIVLIDGVKFIDNKVKGGNGGNSTAPVGSTDYAGAGGGSNFGSGASRNNWGAPAKGTAGGFGGGGSGGLEYGGDTGGGTGGFGAGGGGGASGVWSYYTFEH